MMDTIGGRVRMVDLERGTARLVQLYCDEAASGKRLRGFSGAPVFAGRQPHKVIGMVLHAPPRENDAERVDGGTVYASDAFTLTHAADLDNGEQGSPDHMVILRGLVALQSTLQRSRASESTDRVHRRQLLRPARPTNTGSQPLAEAAALEVVGSPRKGRWHI